MPKVLKQDVNNHLIQSGDLPFTEFKKVTFAGGTPNAAGDLDGTGNPIKLFKTKGTVLIKLFGVVKTAVISAGGGTLVGGTPGNPSVILASLAATALALGDIHLSGTSPTETGAVALNPFVITGDKDIVLTVGTADVTSGVVDYYCLWSPVTSDGSVEAY